MDGNGEWTVQAARVRARVRRGCRQSRGEGAVRVQAVKGGGAGRGAGRCGAGRCGDKRLGAGSAVGNPCWRGFGQLCTPAPCI